MGHHRRRGRPPILGRREGRVEPTRGLEALLETVRSWLERADDDEVLALYGVVRAEMARRMLRRNSVPSEDRDRPADPGTPPKIPSDRG